MRKRTRTPLENIRRARTLNQEQVAAVLGMTQQHYSKIERGLVPAPSDVRLRLSALLAVSTDELFPSEAVAS